MKRKLLLGLAVLGFIITACNNPFFPGKDGKETNDKAPVIIFEDSSLSDVECIKGDEPVLTVSVEGDEDDFSYQWYSNKGGTAIPGATNPTFNPSTDEEGITYYYVVITNKSNGKTTKSRPVKVTVNPGGMVFKVDLSKLSTLDIPSGSNAETTLKGKYTTIPGVKNKQPLTKAWGDVMVLLPKEDLPSDFSKYTRCTITCKYYDASGAEIEQGDSNAIVSLVYDINGDIRGSDMGPGANTPVKEFNVGGLSGMIHKDRGVRVTFIEAPQAVLFQNYDGSKVAFIEMTSLVFHNGDYNSE